MVPQSVPNSVRMMAIALTGALSAGVVLADSAVWVDTCLALLTVVLLAYGAPAMLAATAGTEDDSE